MRLVALWLTKPAAQLQAEEQQWVQAVTNHHPELATAERLSQEFRKLFRDRQAGGLDNWLEAAQASGIPRATGKSKVKCIASNF